ncbi:MAG: PQQ-dependent sugar dehydrogenase [Phycisphaerales bacterium]|nr:PQQ-dependent sugar dehydrogenase [Phycisphaerales bacterium]
MLQTLFGIRPSRFFKPAYIVIATLAAVRCAEHAAAQVPLRSQLIASGLSQPLGGFAIPGDTNRMFVVEQVGRIRILNLTTNTISSTFLDLSASGLNLTAASGERGLLGLAFDPNYVTNGRFYVNYTTLGSPFFTRIDRFTATGAPFANQAAALAATTANTASRVTLYTFEQDFANHNGGALVFGTDGMLYVGVGDGGSANDPNNRAQNLASPLGKLLRLDVNDASAVDGDGLYVPDDNPFRASGNPADKFFAYGMRNPWRITRDRLTGDLYIGDVGQDAQEEIDFQPALTPQNFSMIAGRNYGWDCREGLIATPATGVGCDPNAGGYTDPIKVQPHSGGACSITGGYVYRGSAMPELQGAYFYGDYCGNWIRSFRYNGTTVSDDRDWTSALNSGLSPAPIQGLSSMAEDAQGELYFISINLGSIYKIVLDTANCGCPCIVQPGRPLAFSDNFQTNQGWTTTSTAGTTAGFWQRATPINDTSWAYGPFGDSDGSGQCYVTDNAAGNSDVDNGSVTLTSPLMNWSAGDITLCFDYYLNLTQAGAENPDGLFFEVSSNDGSTWTRVASYTTSNSQSWTPVVIQQSALTTLGISVTNAMRVRFIAADNNSPDQSIIEAGVDSFKVYTAVTITDCNGNGIDDATDIANATSADCNNNSIPDECDIAAAVAAANTAGNQNLRIDLDGGPIGNWYAGQGFIGTNCFGCHGPQGLGGTGPNIRNKSRIDIRNRLYLIVPHPGGGFPGTTAQDHANIEAFLADGGTKGRPDGIIDSCQVLPDCDNDTVSDGRELQLQTQIDLNYNGIPDQCQCECDVNNSNTLTVQDIFDFLALYFSGSPSGDFNGVGGISVQDLFDFLACYFSACP